MSKTEDVKETKDAEQGGTQSIIVEDNASGVEEVDIKSADTTLAFLESHDEQFKGLELTKEEDKKLTNKVIWHLFPLIMAVNTVLFMDKATLSYSSILGLYDSTNLTDALYDDTNSIFYTGYAIGELLNYVLQRTKIRWFMTTTLFTWTVFIFLHCTASNFGGLATLRFFLGLAESVIVPAMEITMLQFYTPKQRATLQPVFWISCSGVPIIIAGFIAYGVLHINSSVPDWKIFMCINGGITLIITACCAVWYPSDPTDAHFLTDKEKYFLIRKIQKASFSAVSQNVVKKSQIVECVKDPISWLFSLDIFLLMLSNNLVYQENLLYVGLGVDTLGTTLVSVAGAGFATVYYAIGAVITHYWPDHTAWIILMGCLPSAVAGIAMITIPWSNKLALVAMLTLGGNTFGLSYVCILGWATATASGNTKRYSRHFMFMIAYSIANIVSPQIWKGNQGFRYYAAWIVQVVLSWVGTPIIAFVITYILKARNNKRLPLVEKVKEPTGIVVRTDAEGHQVEEEVPIANLDLTDLQNKYFIYPL